MTVTVVSCVFGTFRDFVPRWSESIRKLDPAPDEVIVAADRHLTIPGASVLVAECDWKHPQAYYLDRAIRAATTDWVWIVDIDDLAKTDGLAGLEDVEADVWQMGYDRSDGVSYAPTADDVFALGGRNGLVGASAFRVDAYKACGGFRDVAFQDWSLWRQLADLGATFEFSGRSHFAYMLHPYTRSATELLPDVRHDNFTEMIGAELAHA